MMKRTKRDDRRQLKKALKDQGINEDQIREQLDNLETIEASAEEWRKNTRLKITKAK